MIQKEYAPVNIARIIRDFWWIILLPLGYLAYKKIFDNSTIGKDRDTVTEEAQDAIDDIIIIDSLPRPREHYSLLAAELYQNFTRAFVDGSKVMAILGPLNYSELDAVYKDFGYKTFRWGLIPTKKQLTLHEFIDRNLGIGKRKKLEELFSGCQIPYLRA